MEKEWIKMNDREPTVKGWYMVRAIWGSIDQTTKEEKALFNNGHFMYGFDWCTITHWKDIEEIKDGKV